LNPPFTGTAILGGSFDELATGGGGGEGERDTAAGVMIEISKEMTWFLLLNLSPRHVSPNQNILVRSEDAIFEMDPSEWQMKL
jgi:hypothetical protein